MEIFDRIIKAVGTQSKLADHFGITRQAVGMWKKQIPATKVMEISDLTGIPPEEIRPDIFRKPAA